MKKMFKKILLPAVVLFAMLPLLSSCEDDTNTRVALFTITNDLWEQRADGNFYYDCEWSALTPEALSVGNINAYFLLPSDGREYQEPLPYVYLRTFTETDTDTAGMAYDYDVYQPVNIRFDVTEGFITFMLCDLGDLLTEQQELKTMRFRVVITMPTEY